MRLACKPQLSIALCIAGLLSAGSAPGAQLRVYQPILDPSAVHAGASSEVRLGVRINLGSARARAVEVWESQAGVPRVVLASLSDDGRDGDLHAGDGHFGGWLRVEESSAGVREFRVAASIEGEAQTLWSPAVGLEVFDKAVPIGSAPPDFDRTVFDRELESELACDGLLLYAPKGTPWAWLQDLAAGVAGRLEGVAAMPEANAWNLRVPCTSLEGLAQLQDELMRTEWVESVEPQGRGELFGVPFDDPAVVVQAPGSTQRWVELLGHARAWNLSKGARSYAPKIAIIDSGVDYRHRDLVGRVELGRDFVGVNDNDPMDEHGHGTGIAALAGAITNNGIDIAGGAPDAPLFATRVGNQFPTIDHMCDGIEESLQHGASVLNMSLGTAIRSRRLAAAVDQARAAGALVVAGVGNRLRERRFYPAAFEDTEYFGRNDRIVHRPHALAVGSVETSGVLDAFVVDPNQPGSNYGSWVDISAHSFVLVPFPGDQMIGQDGTSVSAPMVSAAAALVWSLDASLDGDAVRDLLTDTAQLTGAFDPAGNPLRRLNTFTAALRAAVQACANCSGGIAAIHPDAFPSPGARITLGFTGPSLPRLRGSAQQDAALHGFSFPLLPRASSLPVPFAQYELRFSTTLRTFDSYAAFPGFFDLFSATLGTSYFDLPLSDDVRPQLNAYFTAAGVERLLVTPAQIDLPEQSVALSTTAFIPRLSVILDTATRDDRDTLRPSWGIVTLHDLTPPAFE